MERLKNLARINPGPMVGVFLTVLVLAIFLPIVAALVSASIYGPQLSAKDDQISMLMDELEVSEQERIRIGGILARQQQISIGGTLDDSNTTGEIVIVILVNRTDRTENAVTLTFKHKKCDESREVEIKFEAKLETELNYNVTIVVDGANAVTKIVYVGPTSSLAFRLWLDGTWKGTVSP